MYLMIAKEESSLKPRHVKGLALLSHPCSTSIWVEEHIKQDVDFRDLDLRSILARAATLCIITMLAYGK